MLLRPGRPAVVVYDAARMVEQVAREEDVEYLVAEEAVAFNTWSAYVGRETPVYATFFGIHEGGD